MKRRHLAAFLLGAAVLAWGALAPAQECLDCHGQKGSTVTFKDGSTRDVTIDPKAWEASVHGSMGAAAS